LQKNQKRKNVMAVKNNIDTQGETPEYQAFIDKFKLKKTTDDCYTPPLIYDAVREWACKEYDIDPDKIVRPFWPGGDYENFKYPDGCVVLDNPPFSILTKICKFYLDKGIFFFLFAPTLTLISSKQLMMRMNHIATDCAITYQNGARVNTSFVTNLHPENVFEVRKELEKTLKKIERKSSATKPIGRVRYIYPDNVVKSSMLSILPDRYTLNAEQCTWIGELDCQQGTGKKLLGGRYSYLIQKQQKKQNKNTKL
jgi:hypothetical protein